MVEDEVEYIKFQAEDVSVHLRQLFYSVLHAQNIESKMKVILAKRPCYADGARSVMTWRLMVIQ